MIAAMGSPWLTAPSGAPVPSITKAWSPVDGTRLASEPERKLWNVFTGEPDTSRRAPLAKATALSTTWPPAAVVVSPSARPTGDFSARARTAGAGSAGAPGDAATTVPSAATTAA